jgi:hypothetical protein
MARSSSLKSDGTLKVFSSLDEVTQSNISESKTYLRAAEFDEITLNPLSNGLVKRQTNDGRILIANIFDEVSVVTRGLTLQLDAEESASYSSGSTWFDISGGTADNITLVNSPTFRNSSPRYFTFNGSNQYGTGSGSVLGTNNYTKQIWFYLNDYQDNNLMSSNSGHFFYFGTSTNRIYSGHTNFGNFMAYGSTATFDLGKWYNAALTFDVTSGFTLYVNGVQDSTYSWTSALPGDGSTNIACFSAGGNLFDGRIAHALAYNVTLTSDEVKQNFDLTKSRYGL